jgi:hypothetical protein
MKISEQGRKETAQILQIKKGKESQNGGIALDSKIRWFGDLLGSGYFARRS